MTEHNDVGVPSVGGHSCASNPLAPDAVRARNTPPAASTDRIRAGRWAVRAAAVFDGAFVLKRLDFAVGDGIWSDVSAVANEVQIMFHIVGAPAAASK